MTDFRCFFCGGLCLRTTEIAREYECVECNRITKIEPPPSAKTPDLTKITTPFGLLDETTRKALRECGGPYEWLELNGEWVTLHLADPAFYLGRAYRLKAQPPKPREWWLKGSKAISAHPYRTDDDYIRNGWTRVREVLE